ncbi:MAG: helix-turn-helix transcriptional regulator [Clostridia bacterium]|nr:helix-turn-helix transcriptional regulator [Clostridia bacterium]
MIQYAAKIDISKYGKLIRKKRVDSGLTEEQLAEFSDLSDREIRNIESGRSMPKLDTVLKIAYALKMDVGELSVLIRTEELDYVS